MSTDSTVGTGVFGCFVRNMRYMKNEIERPPAPRAPRKLRGSKTSCFLLKSPNIYTRGIRNNYNEHEQKFSSRYQRSPIMRVSAIRYSTNCPCFSEARSHSFSSFPRNCESWDCEISQSFSSSPTCFFPLDRVQRMRSRFG